MSTKLDRKLRRRIRWTPKKCWRKIDHNTIEFGTIALERVPFTFHMRHGDEIRVWVGDDAVWQGHDRLLYHTFISGWSRACRSISIRKALEARASIVEMKMGGSK